MMPFGVLSKISNEGGYERERERERESKYRANL
jgi:hypothetical protein